MATIRDLRTRIIGVEKTQKITRAMKMVAAAKLARAARRIRAARPYAAKLREVLGSVASGVEVNLHPLLETRDGVENLEIALFTSDRGLCGAYNGNLVKRARAIIEARKADVQRITLVAVGRKGADAFRRNTDVEIQKEFTGIGSVSQGEAHEVAEYLMQRYRSGEVDEVVLVYSEFHSALSQEPGDERLLPLQAEGATSGRPYHIEPSPEQLLGLLVPRAVEFSVYRAMLENQAGEHGARMTAMDSATSNTEELIETLTLGMNKARQAAITAELVEIVSGADAL